MDYFTIFAPRSFGHIYLKISNYMLYEEAETFDTGMRKIPGIENFEWGVKCTTSLQKKVSHKNSKSIIGIEVYDNNKTDAGNFSYNVYVDKLSVHVYKKGEETYPHNDPMFYIYHDDLHDKADDETENFVIVAYVKCKKPSYCKLTSGADDDENSIELRPFELIKANDDDVSDLDIVVGSDKIKAHKGFLSMISPVFNAMFTHNTKEAQTGVVEIKDFDYAIVKDAIELLYGNPFEPKSVHDVVGMLRFAEKYIIKGATDRLETWVINHLIVDDFEAVIKHAWDHDSDKLKKICGQFYHENLEFTLTPGFRQLDASVAKELADLAAHHDK